ncbi:MAG: prepilin-type N-terminal cleavage/methylation domain-containing protein, partial [Eubacterium sp.]
MQFINKLKKNQKGFTLVELIVVLVILAILAAFTIPAMLGFVDDARSKASIALAREVYVAGQSAAT